MVDPNSVQCSAMFSAFFNEHQILRQAANGNGGLARTRGGKHDTEDLCTTGSQDVLPALMGVEVLWKWGRKAEF